MLHIWILKKNYKLIEYKSSSVSATIKKIKNLNASVKVLSPQPPTLIKNSVFKQRHVMYNVFREIKQNLNYFSAVLANMVNETIYSVCNLVACMVYESFGI